MMKALKEFEIPFVGLKEGLHDYSFEITAGFFESFDYSEVNNAEIKVNVQLEKQIRMLIFRFKMKGFVVVECDRCLDDLKLDVEGDDRLIVKFGQEWAEETEEILIIPEKESKINISPFIYEYIMLMLPYQRVHPEGSCDQEMVSRLSEHLEKQSDPRWDALKDLKGNIE